MNNKNLTPNTSGSTCNCNDDSTAESIDCPPVDGNKKYEALVLACIDPRMQKHVYDYLNDEHKGNLKDNYSQVTIAGAAIGVVAPKFKDWSQTFWDNLSISLELHSIHKVIVINHRGCGAATTAYGYFEPPSEKKPQPKGETQLHSVVMAEFRKQLTEHHPQLEVETLLMSLDGTLEEIK